MRAWLEAFTGMDDANIKPWWVGPPPLKILNPLKKKWFQWVITMNCELKKKGAHGTQSAGQCVDNFCIFFLLFCQKKFSVAAMFMVSCRRGGVAAGGLQGFPLLPPPLPPLGVFVLAPTLHSPSSPFFYLCGKGL